MLKARTRLKGATEVIFYQTIDLDLGSHNAGRVAMSLGHEGLLTKETAIRPCRAPRPSLLRCLRRSEDVDLALAIT
jgi:hypothetical protein